MDGLEAREDVEAAAVGDDRVVPGAAKGHVSGLVADVDPVVAIVAGDDVDAAAWCDGVVAGLADELL